MINCEINPKIYVTGKLTGFAIPQQCEPEPTSQKEVQLPINGLYGTNYSQTSSSYREW